MSVLRIKLWLSHISGEVRNVPKASTTSLPLLSVLDGLLHPSCKSSMERRKRHGMFFALHLTVGLLALAALPFYLLAAGDVGASMALLPIWMLAPLASVAYLSLTGNLANAFVLTATLTAAFITWVASMTGGLLSPHLVWLGVIPLEIALSGNRRLIMRAVGLCAIAVTGLAMIQLAGLETLLSLPGESLQLVGAASILMAILYGGLLAIRIEMLHRGRMKHVLNDELRYRTIADTVSDMITRHDAKGDVTFVSAASRLLLHEEPSHLMGNGLFQRIHIPDRPAYLHALSSSMQPDRDESCPVTIEIQIRDVVDKSDGSEAPKRDFAGLRWVEMKFAPERNSAGEVVGAIVASRDIAQRKKNQLDMEKARNEAQAANAAKTRFLANVTHELRTPLNTIIGFSEILLHPELSQSDPERNREYAELIHNGGHHLLQLVNALLDMSRLESGNFEVRAEHFDLGDLTESCCKMMKTDADRKRVVINNQLGHKLPDVNIDPRACRQILLNLLSNAIKFSDEGGKIAVGLEWARDDKGLRDKTRLALHVKDDGIGIAQKDIEKLGTPFVQADSALDRRFEGTGIGLSIVKGLAQLQHGSMKIESQIDVGTKVTVVLPVDMSAVEEDGAVIEMPEKAKDISGDPAEVENQVALVQ